MKNRVVLLIGTMIVLGTYQVGVALSPSEIGALENAKKRVERTLQGDLSVGAENKAQEIKESLAIIEKYDIVDFKKFNKDIKAKLANLAPEVKAKFERDLNIEVVDLEKFKEARDDIERFKENISDTFESTEGTPGKKWYATYNFALEFYKDYIFNDISENYFNLIIDKFEEYKPTNVAISSQEKIKNIVDYLNQLLEEISLIIY